MRTRGLKMANSSKILKHLFEHTPDAPQPVAYSFLCPNAKGFDNLITILNSFSSHSASVSASHSDSPSNSRPSPGSKTPPPIDLAVFAAATETFSHKNLNA